MGKASRWLKRLLGFKRPDPHSKRRWSFSREKDGRTSPGDQEATRHAIAVAAASAAVAEAAVAAAQAAAAVVSLTTGGGYVMENVGGYGTREEERAAVIIQSHFRAHLSRQALKGLKSVVMLQALVRGQIVRKHLQLLPHLHSSPIYHSGKSSRSNMSYDHHTRTGERSCPQPSFTRIISPDDERNDKILQVDTWKPKHNHIYHFSPQLTHNQYFQHFSISGEIRPLSHVKFNLQDDQDNFTTAENSPQYYSASSSMGSRRALFRTPTKSDSSSDYPSYMAYTESSKAKVRSLSAPKQRPQYERSSSTTRYSFQKASTLHANFTNKVYPGSGRLDRLGMPVRGDVSRFSGGHWHRF